MIKAKLYAILAAAGAILLATLKIVTMQRDAARKDARRAIKHMNEVKDIRKAEKAINAETKQIKKKDVEENKDGKMPQKKKERNEL